MSETVVEVVVVVVVVGDVGEVEREEEGLRWRGTSLPSEKSWSAGSMATGSWRRNSKSGSGSQQGRKFSGDILPMLFTQAEAIA